MTLFFCVLLVVGGVVVCVAFTYWTVHCTISVSSSYTDVCIFSAVAMIKVQGIMGKSVHVMESMNK